MGVAVYYVGKVLETGVLGLLIQIIAGIIIYLGGLLITKDKLLLEGIEILIKRVKWGR